MACINKRTTWKILRAKGSKAESIIALVTIQMRRRAIRKIITDLKITHAL
jgi:hypothetical protein